jgi:hypothetical protein
MLTAYIKEPFARLGTKAQKSKQPRPVDQAPMVGCWIQDVIFSRMPRTDVPYGLSRIDVMMMILQYMFYVERRVRLSHSSVASTAETGESGLKGFKVTLGGTVEISVFKIKFMLLQVQFIAWKTIFECLRWLRTCFELYGGSNSFGSKLDVVKRDDPVAFWTSEDRLRCTVSILFMVIFSELREGHASHMSTN